MNVRLSYLILLLLFTCQSVSATDTKTWLDKLDKSLDRREHFNQIHVDRIEHLRQNMDKARQNGREYEQLYALFNEYKAPPPRAMNNRLSRRRMPLLSR